MEHDLSTILRKLQTYLELGENKPHPNKIFLDVEAEIKAMIKELQDMREKEKRVYSSVYANQVRISLILGEEGKEIQVVTKFKEEEKKLEEGWGWLLVANSNSLRSTQKWHYFVNKRSLCGKYAALGNIELEQGKDDSPDNCAECRRRLARRNQEAKEKEERARKSESELHEMQKVGR